MHNYLKATLITGDANAMQVDFNILPYLEVADDSALKSLISQENYLYYEAAKPVIEYLLEGDKILRDAMYYLDVVNKMQSWDEDKNTYMVELSFEEIKGYIESEKPHLLPYLGIANYTGYPDIDSLLRMAQHHGYKFGKYTIEGILLEISSIYRHKPDNNTLKEALEKADKAAALLGLSNMPLPKDKFIIESIFKIASLGNEILDILTQKKLETIKYYSTFRGLI